MEYRAITKEELAMQVPRIHYCKGCDARIVVCLLPDQPYILLACKCGHVAVYRAEEAEDGLLKGAEDEVRKERKVAMRDLQEAMA